MKKILISVMTVAVVAGLIGAGAFAYFNDTETSTGNTFSAGTIDISVNGQNPWTETFTSKLTNLKPCQKVWITTIVKNEGNNTLELWKHIEVVKCTGGISVYPVSAPVCSSEPEYVEGGGPSYVEKCDIDTVIDYSLTVGGVEIIKQGEKTLKDVHCKWYKIATLLPGASVTVEQDYHMKADTTNWAQGDTCEFNITYYAEQQGGPGKPAP